MPGQRGCSPPVPAAYCVEKNVTSTLPLSPTMQTSERGLLDGASFFRKA
jgi:hypothetical protein